MKVALTLALIVLSIILISGCVSDAGRVTQKPIDNSPPSEQKAAEAVQSGAPSAPAQRQTQSPALTSLKEVYETANPVGMDVKIHGIGLKLSGVSIFDYFLFTDDEMVMKNPSYMAYYGAEYDIIVYNTPKANFEQNLVDVTGKVITCKRASEGDFCIEPTAIDVVSSLVSG